MSLRSIIILDWYFFLRKVLLYCLRRKNVCDSGHQNKIFFVCASLSAFIVEFERWVFFYFVSSSTCTSHCWTRRLPWKLQLVISYRTLGIEVNVRFIKYHWTFIGARESVISKFSVFEYALHISLYLKTFESFKDSLVESISTAFIKYIDPDSSRAELRMFL